MLDDFWGTEEWNRFKETMKPVFPDRPIVEIDNDDAIFHSFTIWTIAIRSPGQWALARGTPIGTTATACLLARHLRRQQSPDGGDVLQLRRRGFMGVGG